MNPEKDPWADLLAGFREDCEKENMTDMDALCAWRMGIEAYKPSVGWAEPRPMMPSNPTSRRMMPRVMSDERTNRRGRARPKGPSGTERAARSLLRRRLSGAN
jgi:hypothetical protein